MKVSLIVVQGKPEGKVIPLAVPRFRIGRGEGCHLRPNNEQVSRNHSEIQIDEDRVVVRDLGSRNGTLVNNKRLEPQTDHVLSNKDLLQIGPLTFAVSIQGMPAAASTDPSERAMDKAASLDELSNDQIDSWLVGENEEAVPERPSGVYTGDTMTFQSFQEATKSDHEVQPVPPKQEQQQREEAEPEEPEPEEPEPTDEEDEPEGEPIYDSLDEDEAEDESTDLTEMPEEFVDESNPFYAAKKQSQEAGAESKSKAAEQADSSQAAEDILRKMMERRRAGQ